MKLAKGTGKTKMAGTMEHIAIALELLKRWQSGGGERKPEELPGYAALHNRCIVVQRQDLFLLGNVIPDYIMSRENYIRPMKMYTHFREGIADYEFGLPENLGLFHQRVGRFVQRTMGRPREDWDLYLGYLTHTLTDELFMLTIRPEFMEKMAPLGLTDRDSETFIRFTFDVDQIDFRLAQEYPGMEQAHEYFRTMENMSVEGMIREEESAKSNRWLLETYFEREAAGERPLYYTYERALQFIAQTVEVIKQRVWEYIG